ncbi:PREDICTED: probable serine/threonine-protein kinase At1g54610 [Tarenaya hassleriana]|uniref:probable serine/threonine-protein kinase At1g54610 n=1 Tax=Tarenaya hassleriana TaxID=28532 RepID=UPI00053C3B78|nr:PREDICTED: probable serine/threonine-protein kinase At1g54610 [Tarenaya hassleriana]XP_010553992.1 PREDICTED: probable serine/threonine-protein kinase At1g54610 [Tarenaya hassleriana]
MGCISSKSTACLEDPNGSPPVHDRENAPGMISGFSSKNASGQHHHRLVDHSLEESYEDSHIRRSRKPKKSGSSDLKTGVSLVSGLSHRNIEAEQASAGWPAWLCSAAAEAVHGWVPLRAEAFEKLEKIGQGTYSSVFRAREVETGKMVALKKVKFDNFQPESIKFMAREILILRKLDHPNIIKLEGIITSRMSSSIYLVFEYMEHDLSGLSSSPDIKFTESQIKCYMKQLLLGLEHCHLRGVIHRDIKASNILVNNQGILKVGDFGLANIITPRNKNQLTSRVVTLWYRAPELLMGSMSYRVSVDLWSVGCVFAEILMGKPILKGRTEIEQLHKIYKLCGSPPDDFWKKCKLPQATVFKPQHTYESTLRDRCSEFTVNAVNLLETFLSIEPGKRGTASSALNSEYFLTKPYACDPSSLPKYPPNKEIDAKHREDLRRKKASMKMRDSGVGRKHRKPQKPGPEPKTHSKQPSRQEMQEENPFAHKSSNTRRGREAAQQDKPFDKTPSEAATTAQGDYYLYLNNSQTAAPASGFAWATKRRKNSDNVSTLTYNQPSSRSQLSGTSIAFAKNTFGLSLNDNDEESMKKVQGRDRAHRGGHVLAVPSEPLSRIAERRGSHDGSGLDLSHGLVNEQREDSPKNNLEHLHWGIQSVSGPLVFQSNKIDELLLRNESRIRRAAKKSQLEREPDDRRQNN